MRVRDRGWHKLEASLRATKEGAHVVVGILSDSKNQRRGEPLTNAVLGFIHEFGSSDGHVPERSFLRATVDAKREKYKTTIRRIAKLVLLGKMTQRQALQLIGVMIQGDVVKTINAGVPPKNAPSTIARKGSSKTLIDTGQLKGAITFEVRAPGGGSTGGAPASKTGGKR